MYLLDTNILSELMRLYPNSNVLDWVDNQYTEDLYISSITIAEIFLGIALLPEGKRKNALTLAAKDTLTDFTDKQLDFTPKAALEYADIVATRTRYGRPISIEDAQIAAIARANSASVVTRNVDDFKETGVEIINPFNARNVQLFSITE